MATYERAGILSIDEVFPYVGKKTHTFRINDSTYSIRMRSNRYKVFKSTGVICVVCGIVGIYFAIERNSTEVGGYHLNLYGKLSNGSEVLMTKDHIIPKSLGGPDTLENLQTMCVVCNGKKGNFCDVSDIKERKLK